MVRTLFALALLAAAPSVAPRYAVVGSLPGPDGSGWDYASVDPAAHRLYVTHGETLAVFDLTGATPPRSWSAIARGHAAVPLPGQHLVLVTSGKDNSVRLLDDRTGMEQARLPVGVGPDAATVDPVTGHVLVVNGEGGSVSEVDPVSRTVVRAIPVKPALEEAAIGPGRTLFVNDEDAGEIETVDLRTGRAGAAIPLPGCTGPTGLAYDRRSDRLIAACANGEAAIVDPKRRRLVKLVAIGLGPDGVLLDAERRVALIPCGRDGVREVISLASMTRVATVRTEPGARTGALDPSTGAAYLPTARFGPLAPGARRPPVLPGSFHVVVVRPA